MLYEVITEQAAVLVSLENLLTFPWLRDAVEAGRCHLHGWYFDIELDLKPRATKRDVESAMRRITSYNVCYTKLLRGQLQDGGHGFLDGRGDEAAGVDEDEPGLGRIVHGLGRAEGGEEPLGIHAGFGTAQGDDENRYGAHEAVLEHFGAAG